MRSLFAALALAFGLLTGMVTTPTTAQALPVAPMSLPAATPDTSVEKVGYYRRHHRRHVYRHYGHRNYGYSNYGYRPHYSGFSFSIGPRYRHHGYRHHGYRHW